MIVYASHAMRLGGRLNDDDENLPLEDLDDMAALMDAEEGSYKVEDTKKPEPKKGDPKFAEVEKLMSKYDKAEAKVRWVNSPEYQKQ